MRSLNFRKLAGSLANNKYVLLVLALGLLLLLLPRPASPSAVASSGTPAAAAPAGDPMEASGIPFGTESERLAALLSGVRGVGDARVLLSREGAVVVCTGADNARVRLDVTNAVSAYTGLGSDQIIVIKME